LLNLLTSSQLSEWEAYDKLDPLGDWRGDYRMANIMALIANINRDSKKKTEPYSVLDFMPEWDFNKEEKKQQSIEDQKRIFLEAFGSKK